MQARIASFLNHCRVEKGLALNSLDAYARDLAGLAGYCVERGWALENLTVEQLRRFLDSRYKARLSSRSIARQLVSIRNFFRFLVQEGITTADPTTDVTPDRKSVV